MGMTDELEKLSELHKSGSLNDVEFAEANGRSSNNLSKRRL